MENIPVHHEEINMPDVFAKEEMSRFITALGTQTKPRGIKQLRFCAQKVYRSLCHIDTAKRDMERILRAVNGKATDVQYQFYAERKVKTTAHKFYSGLSNGMLYAHCAVFGINHTDVDRPYIIDALVEAHVKRQLCLDKAEGVGYENKE